MAWTSTKNIATFHLLAKLVYKTHQILKVAEGHFFYHSHFNKNKNTTVFSMIRLFHFL